MATFFAKPDFVVKVARGKACSIYHHRQVHMDSFSLPVVDLVKVARGKACSVYRHRQEHMDSFSLPVVDPVKVARG